MYIHEFSSLPSLAKSPARGKTHIERKIAVMLYLSNLLKKTFLNTRQQKEKNQTIWIRLLGVGISSKCYLIQLVTFSPSSPAHLTRIQEGDLYHCVLRVRPLHSCLHFKAPGFSRMLGCSCHQGQCKCQQPQALSLVQRAKGA